MTGPFGNGAGRDDAVTSTTVQFLWDRLGEPASVLWALDLKPHQRPERQAILFLLSRHPVALPPEPWLSTLRLLEESWRDEPQNTPSDGNSFHVAQRLTAGERSGALITELVDLVRPRLSMGPLPNAHWPVRKKPKPPSTFETSPQPGSSAAR